MAEEEVKRGHQKIKVRPRVYTMSACIVSMEYKIKNEDGTPKSLPLGESYADAEKADNLLTKTLGWDRNDVWTFKDSKVGIKNIYDKIENEIKELKSSANRIAK